MTVKELQHYIDEVREDSKKAILIVDKAIMFELALLSVRELLDELELEK